MKERPILMNGAMVRSTLNGSKTQTRRIAKNIEGPYLVTGHLSDHWHIGNSEPIIMGMLLKYCPFGQVGDQLWVRETFQGPMVDEINAHRAGSDDFRKPEFCEYAADGGAAPEFMTMDDDLVCRWKPSIHMPRWASRIQLEITGVRIERLNDINEEDSIAEGWSRKPEVSDDPEVHKDAARDWFNDLWESISGPGSWEENPYVWVIQFKRVKP